MSRARRAARIGLPLAVLALALAGAAYLIATKEAPPQAELEARALPVEVQIARPGTAHVELEASGRVVPARRTSVRPQVAGRIATIAAAFEPGSIVKAGEELARLERADYELAVVELRAAVANARLELRRTRNRQIVAQHGWKLYGGKGKAPETADEALARYIPQVEAAERQLAAARSRLARAELDLARTTIDAPFDGAVTAVNVHEGEYVTPQQVLGTIVGVDRFWVETAVDVRRLGAIALPVPGDPASGARARVWQHGSERAARRGRVVRLQQQLADRGNLAQLLVRIDDPLGVRTRRGEPPLLLGSYVQVAIEATPLDDVVAIPRGALYGEDRVWLVDATGTLAPTRVDVAWRGDDHLYVRGLERGQRIVISQLGNPVPGTPVEVVGRARAPEVSGR